jgi:hypothetical protein
LKDGKFRKTPYTEERMSACSAIMAEDASLASVVLQTPWVVTAYMVHSNDNSSDYCT